LGLPEPNSQLPGAEQVRGIEDKVGAHTCGDAARRDGD